MQNFYYNLFDAMSLAWLGFAFTSVSTDMKGVVSYPVADGWCCVDMCSEKDEKSQDEKAANRSSLLDGFVVVDPNAKRLVETFNDSHQDGDHLYGRKFENPAMVEIAQKQLAYQPSNEGTQTLEWTGEDYANAIDEMVRAKLEKCEKAWMVL
jgi:hypothetical protein